MYMVVVYCLLPLSGQNFGVVDNNALDIADTTVTQLDGQLPCIVEEVFDNKMNRCVRFACPPNFKISIQEYKCKPIQLRQPRTNIILKRGLSCLKSLKRYDRLFDYSLNIIWQDYILGSRSKSEQTPVGFLKNWKVPCAIWTKTRIISANDFTSSCQLKYQNEYIAKEELYLQSESGIYFCATYYYESQCLLHFVNMTNTSIDLNNNSLIVRTDGKEITYSVDKFVPIGDMFGVCVVPEAKKSRVEPVVIRVNTVRNVQSLVSAVGSSLSIIFYIVVLVTFFASDEHFSGYGVISMCCCLIFSDGISLL